MTVEQRGGGGAKESGRFIFLEHDQHLYGAVNEVPFKGVKPHEFSQFFFKYSIDRMERRLHGTYTKEQTSNGNYST